MSHPLFLKIGGIGLYSFLHSHFPTLYNTFPVFSSIHKLVQTILASGQTVKIRVQRVDFFQNLRKPQIKNLTFFASQKCELTQKKSNSL